MNWKKFLNSLISVESSGNPNAIGDGGKAVGVLQMWPAVILDVNRIYGTEFTNDDRLDISKSKAICMMYVIAYASEERLGRQPTQQDYALCWHYGPNFKNIPDRHQYWNKVQKLLS